MLKPLFQTLNPLQVCLNSYHQLACHYCPVKGSWPRWAIPVQAERWRQRKLRPRCCPLLCLMERQHFVLSPWQKSSWGLQLPAQELSLHGSGSGGGSLGYNCTGNFYVACLVSLFNILFTLNFPLLDKNIRSQQQQCCKFCGIAVMKASTVKYDDVQASCARPRPEWE